MDQHEITRTSQHGVAARAPQIPAANPTARLRADARMVVSNPDRYSDRPSLVRLAKDTLKSCRAVDLGGLGGMAYIPTGTDQ